MTTITEGLAEIKTIIKRIDSKTNGIQPYLFRQEGLKDPLDKDGGSYEFVRRELQAIKDLHERIVAIRRGIQQANEQTEVTVCGVSRSIADWLVWRRDVAPKAQAILGMIRNHINNARAQAQKAGAMIVANGASPEKPSDVIMNINEKDVLRDIENLDTILGTLDGVLSMKNATVQIKGV